jgi:hypothetical protein
MLFLLRVKRDSSFREFSLYRFEFLSCNDATAIAVACGKKGYTVCMEGEPNPGVYRDKGWD